MLRRIRAGTWPYSPRIHLVMNDPKTVVFPPLYRVANRCMPRVKPFSSFGAILGLQAFLTMALLPVLLYGGAISQQVADVIFGRPEGPKFGTNASIVLGVATTIGATVFVLLGGYAAASVRAMSRAVPARKA
jgi:hypothetical protein